MAEDCRNACSADCFFYFKTNCQRQDFTLCSSQSLATSSSCVCFIAYFGAVLYFNHLFCFPLKSVFFTSMQSFGRFRAVDHRSSLPLTNPIFPSILRKNTGTGLLQCMSVCSSDILWLGLKKSGRGKIFMLLQYQKTITVILFCICSGYEPFRIFIDFF